MDTTNNRKYLTVVKGASYKIPKKRITSSGLVETDEYQHIEFVKGDIDGNKFRQDGIITEGLLNMLIGHLSHLNKHPELNNIHTSNAIHKLQEALFWIEERKRDREDRGVMGTYKP